LVSYINEICPVCLAKFFEEDEVVVCPICGTPHHRDCYNMVGNCANNESHDKGFEWKGDTAKNSKNEFICPHCNKTIAKNCIFCPSCSAYIGETGADKKSEKTGQNQNEDYNSLPFSFFVPSEINPDEMIDGIAARDLFVFVRANSFRYISKFKDMLSTGKKTGWNFAAFLMPEIWFFFRKNYFLGIFNALLTLLWLVLSYPFVNAFEKGISPEIMLSSDYMVVYILSFVMLGIRITFGLYGDYIYKNQVFEAFKKPRKQSITPSEIAINEGGTSFLIPVIVLFCVNFLYQILVPIVFNL